MKTKHERFFILTAAAIVAVLTFSTAEAQVGRVKGYVRKDGTYVQPHSRTLPNATRFDNFSTKGNSSPYTGNRGTVDPYAPRPSRSYRSGVGG